MKQKLTILILTYLIFTMLTGVEVHAQEAYKGYIFIDNIDKEMKSEMQEIIDDIINKEAQLYILEEQAQNLKTKADKLELDGNDQEAGEIYTQLNIFYENNIYPLRWETENLPNTDDDMFVRYIKDIDEKIKQEEIFKVVKKLREEELKKQEDIKLDIKKITSKKADLEPVGNKRRTYMINSLQFESAKSIPIEAFTDEVVEGYSKVDELQEQINIIANELEPENFFKDERIQELLGQIKYLRETYLKEFMDKYNNTNYKIWEIDDIIASLSE